MMLDVKQVTRSFLDFLKMRAIILELTKKDLRAKYLGSYLGILWAFVQPTMTVFIFWFVFEIGFKSIPVNNFPFILWLLSGMIPWFFISDSIASAANSVVENSYLVKKIVFRVSVLPVIKILSALFIHLFFVCFLIVLFMHYGYSINVYYLQLIYYIFASVFLVLGISFITSSLVVFLRDISQFVSMILQFGFWLTPIFWSLHMIPNRYHVLLKINPFFYLVEGYRNTFIYHKWFWQDTSGTWQFWLIASAIFVTGVFLYRRLRPHFADAL